ncbi:hypothetical protein bcgnr5390_17330 [Bacillus luti]
MKKQKLYVVWIGRKPGIYKSWDDCKKQIDEYPNGKFRSVKVDSHAEAKECTIWVGKKVCIPRCSI